MRNHRTIRLTIPFLLAAILAISGCPSGPGRDTGGVPEEALGHNNRGTSLLGQQKWVDAMAEFQLALESRPDDPVPMNNVGVALIQQGDAEQAESWLRKALAADPDFPYAHFNLGLIEKNRGAFEKAVAHFQVVTDHDPDEVSTQYALGASLTRIGRNDEAERALRKALELNPTHVSTLYGLGRLLLQKGNADEGTEMIGRSQVIRARGFDEAVGTQYGEQGPYAMGVDYPAGSLAAPAPIDVTFAVPEGLAGAGHAVAGIPLLLPEREGAALLLARDRALYDASSGEPRSDELPAGAVIRAATVGDVDDDGTAEVVALVREAEAGAATASWSVRATRSGQTGGLQWRTESLFDLFEGAELAPDLDADVALLDRDHDGDLDVIVCWASAGGAGAGCALATNDSSGGFAAETSTLGVTLPEDARGPIGVAFSDVDNDRDIDLLVMSPGGIRLFGNNRDGTFTDLSDDAGLGASVTGAKSLDIADFDKDGLMDLLIGTVEGPRLLPNRKGSFAPAVQPAAPAEGTGSASGSCAGGGATPLDFDNDGFIDVIGSERCELVLFRNLGNGDWTRFDGAFGDTGPVANVMPIVAYDADGDGDLDVAARGPASLGVLVNQGGNANNWLEIRTTGVGDNKQGIGSKVEVLAGALRQKFEVTSPLPLHVGLGNRDKVDTVRLLWPGGVLQDELDRPVREIASVEQLDRKGTSCPLLYAWRDGGWKFVTDFLGGCAIGYQHAPGVFSVPDTDEYVKVEGGLTERDGTLRLRLNNQLEEVIWFDQAALVAVDHPLGTEVFPNERLMPGPPFPGFRLFASPDVRPVAAARDVENDRDVTALLAERDRRYVEGFELLPHKGYAELHTLELDLGDLPRGERIVLLLDGWIDYADSTANIAASHSGAKLIPPRLHVAAAGGRWREVEGLMGFPAGLPKTMSVDLTGQFRGAQHRLRIETTMRIYWDRARVMVGGEDTPLTVHRLAPSKAELRFGGYPRETSPDGSKPFDYDPENVSARSIWKAHAGAYTPFGDITELVREIDDRLATTKHGDEIELAFASPAPPAAGMTRTYLLYADGFGKDMDPNSAANNEVAPVPFHGMPVYPYGSEVVPPVARSADEPVRRVLPSPEGLPGATPLPLVARGETD